MCDGVMGIGASRCLSCDRQEAHKRKERKKERKVKAREEKIKTAKVFQELFNPEPICSRCGIVISRKSKSLCQKCYQGNQPQAARQKKAETVKRLWEEGCYNHVREANSLKLRQWHEERKEERDALKAVAQALVNAALSLLFSKVKERCRFCGLDKWPHELGKRDRLCKECRRKLKRERKRLSAKGQGRCTKCSQVKSLSDFPKKGASCKACNNKYIQQLRGQKSKKIIQAPILSGTKICGKCGEEKPYSEFYKDSHKEDGYRWQCKNCVNTYDKERKWQRHKNYLRLKEGRNECLDCGVSISPWAHDNQRCPECAGKKYSQEESSLPSYYHTVKGLLDEAKEPGTALEHKLAKVLDELGLDHISRRGLPNCPYIYDEYIPELNILVEADGEYWHYSEWANDKGIPENDIQKEQWAASNGYHLVRVRERDVESRGMKACLSEQLFSQLVLDKVWGYGV